MEEGKGKHLKKETKLSYRCALNSHIECKYCVLHIRTDKYILKKTGTYLHIKALDSVSSRRNE